MQFSYRIKSTDIPLSLLEFLTERYTYYSISEWQLQIENRKVLINGIEVSKDHRPSVNDEISFIVDDFIEPEIDSNFSLLYEDEFLFAINKSGNLPVHPAGRYRENNLCKLLEKSGYAEHSFIVNRLDRETSGIVLFAKSAEPAAKLGKLFENGKVNKTYISYVEGIFPDSLSANGFLSKDENSKIRKKKKFSYEKDIYSLWEVNTDFALIEVKDEISKIFAYPHTGKIHQIRATLYSLGYPLVGDKMYGLDDAIFLDFIQNGKCEARFGMNRQALHAYGLEFIHPFTDKILKLEAEEPSDMKSIFNFI